MTAVPITLRGVLDSARNAGKTAGAVLGKTVETITDTGKRLLSPMTTGGIPETLELVDGVFLVAIRIRKSMATGSPGGEQITADEILHSISDGEFKNATRALVDAIRKIVRRDPVDLFDLVPILVDAINDWMATLRSALADRRITASEILAGVSTQGLRSELEKAINGAEKIPAEMARPNLMTSGQLMMRAMQWLPQLLAAST